MKDKCDAIRNLESPKTLRQTRAFCGMVNFLSSFLPNFQWLLIPIYDLQKKVKTFKWTDEVEKAFNEIKTLLVSPPVQRAPTPDCLFRLESDTLREGVGGTLLHKQGDKWVVIGYHSKRLPKSAKNFGVTKLELMGLLVNIHGFTDTPDNKDVIPLNFLQHITPNYIEYSYSHFVETLYTHKTKKLDATPIKQKCGRPPKPKPEIPISKTRTPTAAKTQTT